MMQSGRHNEHPPPIMIRPAGDSAKLEVRNGSSGVRIVHTEQFITVKHQNEKDNEKSINTARTVIIGTQQTQRAAKPTHTTNRRR